MAILFDEVDDYYSIADAGELALQDGDWCIGIWSRVDDNSGSNAQYLLSNNNLGANDSINLWLEESGSGSSPNEWSLYGEDSDGTNTGTLRCGATGADSTWRLIIIQRRTADNEIQIWFCEQNGAASKVDSVADTNFDAVDGGDWNIARRVDGNADRYYGGTCCELFKGDFSLTQVQIESLAAGTTIDDLASGAGLTLDLYLPMTTADATLADESGSGNDATRHGNPSTVDHPGVLIPTTLLPIAIVSSAPGVPASEIWLTTDAGLRIAQLDDYLWLDAGRVANAIGTLGMGLKPSFDTRLIKLDRMIQVWLAPRDGALSLWRAYFIRKWRFATAENGQESITIWGPDQNDLLRRRIVVGFSGSSYASKTDYADDMMKEVVSESISDTPTPAPEAGTRVWSNLSIAGDLSNGPSISKSFNFGRLLHPSGSGALPDIARAAREAGTEVFFDIVPAVVSSSSITFQFRTYTGQPGQDVTGRVVFDQEHGNLKQPYLEIDYEDEVNYVYAGGQGEREDRNIQQVYDATRYGLSQWNRCEAFADARDQGSDNGVREKARALLEEGRPKRRFGGIPVDTKGTRFGKDWDFGYKVRARYWAEEFDAIIRAVTVSLDDSGRKVQARLDYED
jgi:hypothetical protein